jgi:hypothetical protein
MPIMPTILEIQEPHLTVKSTIYTANAPNMKTLIYCLKTYKPNYCKTCTGPNEEDENDE